MKENFGDCRAPPFNIAESPPFVVKLGVEVASNWYPATTVLMTTTFYHAVYAIAAIVYGAYVASLVIRVRRATARLEAAKRQS